MTDLQFGLLVMVAVPVACAAGWLGAHLGQWLSNLNHRPTDRRVSQLRRRQLDDLHQVTPDPRTDSHPPD